MSARVRGVTTRGQIEQEYLDWMTRLVCQNEHAGGVSWNRLFAMLYRTEFTYLMRLDENRAVDGRDLRYRFAYECGHTSQFVKNKLDCRPCSVLEMMIALAIRCEEHIMTDPDSGNRTGKWFFEMVHSLGLIDMHDSQFDVTEAQTHIIRFLEREYDPDGSGGLFTLKHPHTDMRQVEIWYQAMWYLSEMIHEERT